MCQYLFPVIIAQSKVVPWDKFMKFVTFNEIIEFKQKKCNFKKGAMYPCLFLLFCFSLPYYIVAMCVVYCNVLLNVRLINMNVD